MTRNCVTVKYYDFAKLKICFSSGKKISRTYIMLNDGENSDINANVNDEVLEKVMKYIEGKVEPEEIIEHLKLDSGIKGLVQLAVLSIPRGYVASYMQIAKIVGTSPRAVGRIVALNELPVLVPCHRVIKSNGELGGFSQGSCEVKKKLLEVEGVKIHNSKISKKYFVDSQTLKIRFMELVHRLDKK